MATTEQMQARLVALEDVEFNLVAGLQATALNYNGEQVTYQPTQLAEVRNMIRALRRDLGLAGGRRPSARGIVV
jgi:hypothetical protein